jgi:hypothetical protein
LSQMVNQSLGTTEMGDREDARASSPYMRGIKSYKAEAVSACTDRGYTGSTLVRIEEVRGGESAAIDARPAMALCH